jgi:GH25 family lysozyme M1 (1,4-beta-N-acetylmuramidase)
MRHLHLHRSGAPGTAARGVRLVTAGVAALATAVMAAVLTVAGPAHAATNPAGLDVSAGQGAVNWAGVKTAGGSFAYVKATEGAGYLNPDFAQQYNGSYGAGLIRGAYHFALPDRTDGATQADYFIANGGGWSADGRTLPGAIDIEYNPYKIDPTDPRATCYDLSNAAMVSWLHAFLDRYKQRTGRDAVIYTTTDWWTTCTGNSPQFSANPLWLSHFASAPGGLPASWSSYTIWQHADSGTLPGDQDVFNGTAAQLASFAKTSTGTTNLAPTVTVLASNTTACQGTQQYYTGTDGAGVPIDWTYANGTTACVKVGYAPHATSATCSFSFYVPDGEATAQITFGYWTTDGVKHYAGLNENPVIGWQQVFSAANVNRIEFQDNDGQAYPLQIGWGSSAAYGMRQTC